jgi:hypothetical protein
LDKFRQRRGRATRHQAGDFNPSHRGQGPQLKAGNETAADDAVTNGGHGASMTKKGQNRAFGPFMSAARSTHVNRGVEGERRGELERTAPSYSHDWKRTLPAMKKTTAKATSIMQHSKIIRGSGEALLNSSS